MDNRHLKVGTKVNYAGHTREILTIEERNGKTFLSYAHNGQAVPGMIEANRFSPGATIIPD